jgi:large subunit ribosomal protein L25
MEELVLNAERRDVSGKNASRLRRAGYLPAVVYGPGAPPTPIQLNAREAVRLFRRIEGTQLIDLVVEGESRKALLHEMQRDPIRGDYLHVDFYAPDMTRTLRVAIPIFLTGSSFAVNSLSGVLVRGITDLAIECLPADLIPSVTVDISPLKEIGQSIHVSGIQLPANIKVLSDPDDMIARVTYQAKEEDLAAAPTTTTTEVEVVEKGKKEEEGEEGE